MEDKRVFPVPVSDLAEAILNLENRQEVSQFFKDLCTPQEVEDLQERWVVCQLLESEEFSYREIAKLTGASLVTIGRVARFLKLEPHHGYKMILQRIKEKK